MSSSQQSSSFQPDGWNIPFAFGVLVCLPLIIGALRQISEPMKPAATVYVAKQPVAKSSDEVEMPCLGCPAEQTMLVTCFPDATASQADEASASEEAAEPAKDSDDTANAAESAANEGEKLESEQKQQESGESQAQEAESADGESADGESEDGESEDGESEDGESIDGGGAEDQEEQRAEDEEEIVCCDAASEFEQWTVTLDDTIQKAVANAITSQLETSTNNLDRTHARLERLLVETELYKLQIQHLRNRLKEWQPVETDEKATDED